MPRESRLRAWMAACAIAVGTLVSAQPVSAQTGAEPVLETRCRPRLACWIDHWGYRRCSRRWVCADEPETDFPRRPPAPRRYSLEEDYVPESGIRRDREPSLRRYRGSDEPVSPEIVRPFRENRPPELPRHRVTVRPRLKEVPGREPAADPDAEARKPAAPGTDPKTEAKPDPNTNRPDEPETASRRERPTAPDTQPDVEPRVEAVPHPDPAPKSQPDTGPKVEIIPRPQTAPPEKESPRLKEPPAVPPMPDTEAPAPAKLTPLPRERAPKRPEKKPDDRKTDAVPDDIDKLPRGRKIPMDEIDPPKPKKKLPERLPI